MDEHYTHIETKKKKVKVEQNEWPRLAKNCKKNWMEWNSLIGWKKIFFHSIHFTNKEEKIPVILCCLKTIYLFNKCYDKYNKIKWFLFLFDQKKREKFCLIL